MIESYLYSSSLAEFMRFKRLWPWLLIAVFGLVLAAVWPMLSPNASQTEQYSNVSSMLTFHVLALASAIFTTAIVSQEVEQKTIVYLLTRPVPRWKLLVMRYLASATVVAVLSCVGALFVSAGVYKAGLLNNHLLYKDMIALTFGAFAYGALFLLVSLMFNRAMIICLLFAFGWETSVPNMFGEMYRLSVYSYLQAIAEHPATASPSGALGAATGNLSTNVISSSTAYATLIILAAVLLAAGAAWFTRFEYVPREDAE